MVGRGVDAGIACKGEGRYSLFHSGLTLCRGGVAKADSTSDTARDGLRGGPRGAVEEPPCA